MASTTRATLRLLHRRMAQPRPPFVVASSSLPFSTSGAAAPTNDSQKIQRKGFFGQLKDKLSHTTQQQRVIVAERLFQAATRQAQDPRWYGPGRIGRDFRARHAMLTMHVWFLHKRLIASADYVTNNNNDTNDLQPSSTSFESNLPTKLDPDQALNIQEELFDILWNDTQCRIRQQGVPELRLNKLLLQVQQYTFLHLFHYDHIYHQLKSSQTVLDEDGSNTTPPPMELPPEMMTSDDDDSISSDPLAVIDPTLDLTITENRISELKKLLWMHVLGRDAQAHECDDHLTRLAWYIEAQYQNILVDWPHPYMAQGRVQWVNLPDFRHIKDNHGKVVQERLVHPDDLLPPPWLTNITLRGETYYWNPETNESRWERPTHATGVVR